MATATTRLTYQDLQRIPQDCNRYELIEGELFVAAAPNIEHQRKAGRLFVRLAFQEVNVVQDSVSESLGGDGEVSPRVG
jgi:Uma2 family endonuclease